MGTTIIVPEFCERTQQLASNYQKGKVCANTDVNHDVAIIHPIRPKTATQWIIVDDI